MIFVFVRRHHRNGKVDTKIVPDEPSLRKVCIDWLREKSEGIDPDFSSDKFEQILKALSSDALITRLLRIGHEYTRLKRGWAYCACYQLDGNLESDLVEGDLTYVFIKRYYKHAKVATEFAVGDDAAKEVCLRWITKGGIRVDPEASAENYAEIIGGLSTHDLIARTLDLGLAYTQQKGGWAYYICLRVSGELIASWY